PVVYLYRAMGSIIEEPGTERSRSITDLFRHEQFYHGIIMKTDAEALLKKEGDFVLRKTEHYSGVIVLCLSVRTDGEKDTNKSYFVDPSHKETSISKLITYYINTNTPLTLSTNAKLKKSMDRPPWVIDHDSIYIIRKIAPNIGTFSTVYTAKYGNKKGNEIVVAKALKSEANRDTRCKFMKEARMMRYCDHPNVLKILGVALHYFPIIIVMEWCEGGTMSLYLKKNGK
ncbi:hypothetical protein PENTCL1PPCAC_22544, partial [Pristionchus entomophagus]